MPGLRFALLLGSQCGAWAGASAPLISPPPRPPRACVGRVHPPSTFPRLNPDVQTFPHGTAGTKLLPLQERRHPPRGPVRRLRGGGKSIEAAGPRAGPHPKVDYEERPAGHLRGLPGLPRAAARRSPESAGRARGLRPAREARPGRRAAHADRAPHEEMPAFLDKMHQRPSAATCPTRVCAGGEP